MSTEQTKYLKTEGLTYLLYLTKQMFSSIDGWKLVVTECLSKTNGLNPLTADFLLAHSIPAFKHKT